MEVTDPAPDLTMEEVISHNYSTARNHLLLDTVVCFGVLYAGLNILRENQNTSFLFLEIILVLVTMMFFNAGCSEFLQARAQRKMFRNNEKLSGRHLP